MLHAYHEVFREDFKTTLKGRWKLQSQSYNYVIGEKFCELNTRTKEARPENFQPDGSRFYMGRFKGRSMYPV